MLGTLADDQDHLGFVIERLGDLRTNDRLTMSNKRGRAAHEDGGKFRQVVALGAFLDVLKVIQAQANDLSGAGHRQPIGQARQRLVRVRRRPLGKVSNRLHIAIVLRKPVAKIGRRVAVDSLQINGLIAFDDAQPRSTLPLERNDFHDLKPSLIAPRPYAGPRL